VVCHFSARRLAGRASKLFRPVVGYEAKENNREEESGKKESRWDDVNSHGYITHLSPKFTVTEHMLFSTSSSALFPTSALLCQEPLRHIDGPFLSPSPSWSTRHPWLPRAGEPEPACPTHGYPSNRSLYRLPPKTWRQMYTRTCLDRLEPSLHLRLSSGTDDVDTGIMTLPDAVVSGCPRGYIDFLVSSLSNLCAPEISVYSLSLSTLPHVHYLHWAGAAFSTQQSKQNKKSTAARRLPNPTDESKP
jgi:hypothetical protein